MTIKNIKFGQDACDAIVRGVDQIVNAVKATLGPCGRNVIIDMPDPYALPRMTKDGVTVARAVKVHDLYEKIAARIAKGASEKQNFEAGDGTTTVMVLTQAIVREGMKARAAGMDPMQIKRGIEEAAEAVTQRLRAMSKSVQDRADIYNVAYISANGDIDIATKIADGLEKVGKQGILTVEESKSGKNELEIVEGLLIDKGFADFRFINRSNYTCELENPYVFLYDGKLSRLDHLAPFLEEAIAQSRAVVLIADGFEEQVMQTLLVNKQQNNFRLCAVHTPKYGKLREDILQDIATMTGAPIIGPSSDIPLENFRAEHAGSAARAIIKKDTTVLTQGRGDPDAIKNRCDFMQAEILKATAEDKKNLEVRLASMTGGIAVIKVGAATDVEIKERRDRVEDAVHATRAAIAGGIVAGGGAALAHASSSAAFSADGSERSQDRQAGISILLKACMEPVRQIAGNAGKEGSMIAARVTHPLPGDDDIDPDAFGYDAAHDKYCDLIVEGVLDPANVIIAAVRNAASVGGLLITTEVILADEKEDIHDK